jgi:hypothetical protein
MPCYQSNNLPGGVTTTGRTSYRTEAECNQACREGACCEGTTCTVKPQCQCVCQSGSCCGPDTFTNSYGETGPRCRNESESACAARGGVWRCGVNCIGLVDDPFAGQPRGSGICTSLAGSPSTPVFKGIGTTCTPNPCPCCNADGTPKSGSNCSPCWCLCGEGSARYPRFVNVSISFKYDVYQEISRPPLRVSIREKSASGTVTMSLAGEPSRNSCPVWVAGRSGFGDSIPEPVSFGGGTEGALILTAEQVAGTQDLRWRLAGVVRDYSGRPTWSTAFITPDGQNLIETAYGLGGTGSLGGPYTSGTCFSNMSSYQSNVQGVLRDFSFSINGVQA